MSRAIIIILILAAIVGGCGISQQNTLAELRGEVDANWAQVENQYQRRADLIPNLVETVKGYSDFEKETLENITNARARVGQVQISGDDLADEAKMKEFMEAQSSLGSSLSRLLVVSENYPDLKSNTVFRDLMAQLEGTENRISTERRRYINASKDYNVHITKFPASFFANFFGYSKVANFEAAEGAEQAPSVNFN
ncbi:MAG: LemA family protein [Bacteroidota bacterium]